MAWGLGESEGAPSTVGDTYMPKPIDKHVKPTQKDKELIEKHRKLKHKQLNIIQRMLTDSDAWRELNTLLRASEVNTEKRYKSINKFDPHLEPLENYQLVVDYVTAMMRHWQTLEGPIH